MSNRPYRQVSSQIEPYYRNKDYINIIDERKRSVKPYRRSDDYVAGPCGCRYHEYDTAGNIYHTNDDYVRVNQYKPVHRSTDRYLKTSYIDHKLANLKSSNASAVKRDSALLQSDVYRLKRSQPELAVSSRDYGNVERVKVHNTYISEDGHLRQQINDLKTAYNNVQAENSNLQGALKTSQVNVRSEINDLRLLHTDRVNDMQRQIDYFQSKFLEMETHCQKLHAEIDALRSAPDLHDRQTEISRQRIISLEKERDDLRSQIHALRAQMEQSYTFQNDNIVLRTELDEHRQRVKHLLEEKSTMHSRLLMMENDNRSNMFKSQHDESILAKEHERIIRLYKTQLTEKDIEINDIKNQNELLQERLHQTRLQHQEKDTKVHVGEILHQKHESEELKRARLRLEEAELDVQFLRKENEKFKELIRRVELSRETTVNIQKDFSEVPTLAVDDGDQINKGLATTFWTQKPEEVVTTTTVRTYKS